METYVEEKGAWNKVESDQNNLAMKLWMKNIQDKVYSERIQYLDYQKDNIMKLKSFEKK